MSQERLTRRRWSVARQNSARSLRAASTENLCRYLPSTSGGIAGREDANADGATHQNGMQPGTGGRVAARPLLPSLVWLRSHGRPCNLTGCAARSTGSRGANGIPARFFAPRLQRLPEYRMRLALSAFLDISETHYLGAPLIKNSSHRAHIFTSPPSHPSPAPSPPHSIRIPLSSPLSDETRPFPSPTPSTILAAAYTQLN